MTSRTTGIRTPWFRVFLAPVFAVCLALLPLSAFGQAGPSKVIPPSHHDVSPPLRTIPGKPHASGPPREMPEPGPLPIPQPPSGAAAPQLAAGAVEQNLAPAQFMPSASKNFEGVGAGLSGYSDCCAPPDTNGDIGPNHYVQIVNTDLAVFSRSGTILLGPESIKTLWSGFGGGCQINDDGDPVVKYDRRADRWIVSQFSVSSSPYQECIAVSTSGDPTGSYYRYAYSFPDFPDYPKMGVWPDGYYFTYNIFSGTSGNYIGGEVCAYDRATMLTGGAATTQCFPPVYEMGGSLPSDVDGPADPPSSSPNFVLTYGTNSLLLWKAHVDWATPANSTLTGPTTVSVAAFSAACGGGNCIPQSGTTVQLDSLADRVMYRLAYRNFGNHESLVVNHSVTPSGAGTGVSGIRWYEIRSPNASPTVFQQGTYAPADGLSRWMGSAAMDENGDLAIGYSTSSASANPSIAYAGRLVGDPAGALSQGETTLQTGTGSQTTYNHKALTRWGDYSSLAVDPSDDCTFWYTTEYLTANGAFNWHTRIGAFKFPSCGCVSTPTAAASGSKTICVGSSTGLSGSGGVSCSWSPSAGLSNASSCAPTASPLSTTTYTLTVYDASGCASTNDPTATVTVNPKPAPTITPNGPTTFCQGGSVTLDAGAGYSSYLWAPGGATTRTVNVTSSGSYSVAVTNSSGCSGTSSPVSVTVNPRPTAVASGSATICAGTSTPLSGSGGTSCSWSPSTGLSNPSSCTPSASPSSSTTYSLTVTASNGCTSTNTATATVTVNSAPATPVISAPTSADPGTTGLTASVANHGGSSYAWSITNGSITSGQGSAQIKFTAGSAGSLTLQVVETNSSGCPSPTGSINVTVNGGGGSPPSTVFYSLTPCRAVDTRNANGPLGGPKMSAGQTRTFPLGGVCGVPTNALGVSINLTIADASTIGNLVIWPGSGAPPGTNAISFAPGKNRANNAVIGLVSGNLSVLDQQTSGTVNVIIDVNGYFK